MTESIADLQMRRDLLKEIAELGKEIAQLDIPTDDAVDAVAGYVQNLMRIEGLDKPSEEEMEAVQRHLAALIEIEQSDAMPGDDEIEKARDHLARLMEIEKGRLVEERHQQNLQAAIAECWSGASRRATSPHERLAKLGGAPRPQLCRGLQTEESNQRMNARHE
ncbi:hypothetical protein [Bradyrhizobium sp. 162]|uniref:hypothetical protein n=1 Tax=Bradyrhizobium sp. 162 TaxID=2782635 RepID=UPI001FF8CD73|nr:hypothetical protein [Bradyrhizobium sp. 162]MCK1632658.1 hypothetical protein [Bradyrhizobium sp. 162]